MEVQKDYVVGKSKGADKGVHSLPIVFNGKSEEGVMSEVLNELNKLWAQLKPIHEEGFNKIIGSKLDNESVHEFPFNSSGEVSNMAFICNLSSIIIKAFSGTSRKLCCVVDDNGFILSWGEYKEIPLYDGGEFSPGVIPYVPITGSALIEQEIKSEFIEAYTGHNPDALTKISAFFNLNHYPQIIFPPQGFEGSFIAPELNSGNPLPEKVEALTSDFISDEKVNPPSFIMAVDLVGEEKTKVTSFRSYLRHFDELSNVEKERFYNTINWNLLSEDKSQVEDYIESVQPVLLGLIPEESFLDKIKLSIDTFSNQPEGGTLADMFGITHNIARAKGWYDKPQRNIGEMLMLIVTELTEAFEGFPDANYGEEIADVFIRLFDLAGYMGFQYFGQSSQFSEFAINSSIKLNLSKIEEINSVSTHVKVNIRDYKDFGYELFKCIDHLSRMMELIRLKIFSPPKFYMSLNTLFFHLLDICLIFKIDIYQEIITKTNVNLKRPYKHGKTR